MYTWKNQLQHNLPTPAQQKTRGGGQTDPQITSWWERPSKERPKTKDIHRANINHSPRSVRSGDQGDCTLNLTGILSQKFTPKTQGVRTEQLKKQRLTGRVSQTMGRQRNNPQMKGKGEVSETMLNEKEASQLPDTEFKDWL